MFGLEVKNVKFCETELLAVQEQNTGKIYVGVNPILRDLGFDEKQIEYRREKWISDKSLKKGTQKFSGTFLGLKTGKEVWCIDIMKLPLAIAKLEITPKMEKDLPKISEKLEEYQDKCADVLAAAFLPQTQPSATYQYPLPATTFEGVANLGRLIEKVMRSEGACPHEIALVLQPIFQQAGINVQEGFIKIPAYVQYELSI